MTKDYFMWFATGTETLTREFNQDHKYPQALLSADMVTHFDGSSPKSQSDMFIVIFCLNLGLII